MNSLFALAVLVTTAAPGSAAPTADALLSRYDALMGPPNFEAVMTMTAHREDGSSRRYRMRILKSGTEKARVWLDEPASVRGQEVLRQGDNAWVYMPNLKRAIRLANRDSFQGGDFNNGDVLRINYRKDYEGEVVEDPAKPNAWVVDLKAKTPEATYDRVKLWLDRADGLPLQAEYYAASGKMLRAAEFTDVRDFGGGLRRPARIVMRNMIATRRHSEMTVENINLRVVPPAGRFVVDDLGR